jgi:hypothetical protein
MMKVMEGDEGLILLWVKKNTHKVMAHFFIMLVVAFGQKSDNTVVTFKRVFMEFLFSVIWLIFVLMTEVYILVIILWQFARHPFNSILIHQVECQHTPEETRIWLCNLWNHWKALFCRCLKNMSAFPPMRAASWPYFDPDYESLSLRINPPRYVYVNLCLALLETHCPSLYFDLCVFFTKFIFE